VKERERERERERDREREREGERCVSSNIEPGNHAETRGISKRDVIISNKVRETCKKYARES